MAKRDQNEKCSGPICPEIEYLVRGNATIEVHFDTEKRPWHQYLAVLKTDEIILHQIILEGVLPR